MDNIEKGELAYDHEWRGYHIVATYLEQPAGDALIEITKDDDLVKEFLWPSYKVWNLVAHADDIVDGLEADSDIGLRIAGSDGLGGNAYQSGS